MFLITYLGHIRVFTKYINVHNENWKADHLQLIVKIINGNILLKLEPAFSLQWLFAEAETRFKMKSCLFYNKTLLITDGSNTNQ